LQVHTQPAPVDVGPVPAAQLAVPAALQPHWPTHDRHCVLLPPTQEEAGAYVPAGHADGEHGRHAASAYRLHGTPRNCPAAHDDVHAAQVGAPPTPASGAHGTASYCPAGHVGHAGHTVSLTLCTHGVLPAVSVPHGHVRHGSSKKRRENVLVSPGKPALYAADHADGGTSWLDDAVVPALPVNVMLQRGGGQEGAGCSRSQGVRRVDEGGRSHGRRRPSPAVE
jgi:hypothetical protein